jgi:hypothetical protein
VVSLAIVRSDDGTVARCQHRPAEGEESLWRFGGQRGAPVMAICRPVTIVHPDEVDGVSLAPQVSPVARDPASWTVPRQPPARERQGDDDRRERTIG